MEGHRLKGRKRGIYFVRPRDLIESHAAAAHVRPMKEGGGTAVRVLAYLRRVKAPRSMGQMSKALFGTSSNHDLCTHLLALSDRRLIRVLNDDLFEAT